MIEIEVKGGDPQALADLIEATLHGHIPGADPQSTAVTTGKLVREQQEQAERRRPSRDQIETVNFTTIDDDQDWSDL
jgi:hypothetical protein